MIKEDTIDFLKSLRDNNNREWFNTNKEWYERAKENVQLVAAELLQSMSKLDPGLKGLEPKKCMFRIYRDTRFSSDKTPYKTNFGIVLRPINGSKIGGYYLHISPDNCFVSCGFYMPSSAEIKKIRRGIYDDFEMIDKILKEKDFNKEFGSLVRSDDDLQRIPNGFEKDHSAAEFLKLKHFYVSKSIPEKYLYRKDFVAYATEKFRLTQPLLLFLNDLLEN